MMDHEYDSPTFLSQKDKYFMGLSMVQMLGIVAIAGMTFMFSLMLPMGILMRVVLVVVVTVGLGVMVFGRIAGLSVPNYLVLMALSPLRRTVYEEDPEILVAGSSEFLLALEEKEARAKRDRGESDGWVARTREFATSDETAQRRNELKAEVNKGMVEGAQSLEGMVKEGLRNLKG